MTKFNYCPMCGEPVSHYDEYCKVCDYSLDRKITSERKKRLNCMIFLFLPTVSQVLK